MRLPDVYYEIGTVKQRRKRRKKAAVARVRDTSTCGFTERIPDKKSISKWRHWQVLSYTQAMRATVFHLNILDSFLLLEFRCDTF